MVVDFSLDELEDAASDAWPAPIRERRGSVELRMSGETSNRANSVHLAGPLEADLGQVIEFAGRFYAAAGKPLQFCVSDAMSDLDLALEARGFAVVDPCFYMVKTRADLDLPLPAPPDGFVLDVAHALERPWLSAWASCAAIPPSEQEGAFAVVMSVSLPSAYALVTTMGGEEVAVGRAVDTGSWRGLHNLATKASYRDRGIGSAVARALEADPGSDAKRIYLQVEEDNPAVRLYKRFGYHVPGGYHYRRAPRLLQ